LGAGWFEAEHSAYGIPFPPLGERFEKLEEQLSIITGLWETKSGDVFRFSGQHYSLADSPALPKPVQRPRPPIIIGGHGAKRTPRLAARFADEYNVPFAPYEVSRTQFERVDAACDAVGRDPGSVVRSVALVVCCGANDEDVARRAAAIGREVAELQENGLAGRPEEVAAKIKTYEALGVTRVYLQVLDIDDLDHVRLIARDVLPAVS
jgi:alkanesulfonate monooxygenase